MSVVDGVVIALRVIAGSFALWNLTWSAAGARSLMHGQFRPPEIYLSVVFWMSVAVLVFQCSYLAGQTDSWRLLAYTILATTMGLAAVGHRAGMTIKARQFYAMWDHLGVAAAIVDLARLDAAAAGALADEARRQTAAKVLTIDG